jgi:hypothetical protein
LESPRIQAAKNGQRKYTGKPCKACGETLRYTINSACVACTNKAKGKTDDAIRAMLDQAQKAGA